MCVCANVCIQGLGAQSSDIHSFLLPLIQLSTDVAQPPHVYLCEDGLTLWHTVLQCTSAVSQGLLDLYTNMPRLLGGFSCRVSTPVCGFNHLA